MMKKMLPIIILILVLAGGGVGAYFYFKKKKSDGSAVPSEAADPSAAVIEDYDVDVNNTDDIIEATSMTSAQKTKAKNWVKQINKEAAAGTNGWSKSTLLSRAQSTGVTYEQYVVLSALWQMYQTQGYITKSQCESFSNEVKNL
jgi:uncharacterized protein (UPF0333 family)